MAAVMQQEACGTGAESKEKCEDEDVSTHRTLILLLFPVPGARSTGAAVLG